MPELNAALSAVEKIDKVALTSFRTMPSPPPIVEIVFSGICTLFGEKKTDWAAAKGLL